MNAAKKTKQPYEITFQPNDRDALILFLARSLAEHAVHIRDKIVPGLIKRSRKRFSNYPLKWIVRSYENYRGKSQVNEEFSDFFAQVAAIGTLAAACLYKPGQPFRDMTRMDIYPIMNRIHPLLDWIFVYFIDPEILKTVETTLDKILDMLNNTRILLMKNSIDNLLQTEELDKFNERFIGYYDPRKKEKLGMFATPAPVISFIVRSIDHILKEKLGKVDGLGDPGVIILEPACGTGSFFSYIVQSTSNEMARKYGEEIRNPFIHELVKERLYGYEISVTPFILLCLRMKMILKGTASPGNKGPDGLQNVSLRYSRFCP
jgi:hypothetical protein